MVTFHGINVTFFQSDFVCFTISSWFHILDGRVSFLPSELHHHMVTSITGLLTERDGQPKG